MYQSYAVMKANQKYTLKENAEKKKLFMTNRCLIQKKARADYLEKH